MKILAVLMLIFLLTFPSITPPEKMNKTRRRTLLLVGGGRVPENIQNKFIELSGGNAANLVFVTSATEEPENVHRWWEDKKICSYKVLYAKSRHEGEAHYLDSNTTGVWFTGGDQSRLANIYLETIFQKELKRSFNNGVIIGGSSAGASIVSSIMMNEGQGLKGLGLLDNIIVDQHFSQRQRLPRLLNLLKEYPTQLGIGIDEKTGIIIREDEVSVIGNGNVTFCKENISVFKENESFSLR